MQWIIQNSIGFSALQDNCLPLVNVLREMAVPHSFCGIALDQQIITGLEEVDSSKPVIFYGATLLPILVQKLGIYSPGVYWNDDWWKPEHWIQNRQDLLNQDIRIITFQELSNNWGKFVSEPTFIKSNNVKILTGQVIEPEEHDSWLDEHILNPEDLLCLSPYQKIESEWRFWIVNGKLITGSYYKDNGCRITRKPITKEVWDIAEHFSEGWLPNPNIVMDIALLANGKYKVIEFNSINSSGFYNSQIRKVVESLELL
jgi:ATP-grasp domain, R2K clade family 3